MDKVSDEKYQEFENKFVALFYEVFQERPTRWVIPVISTTEEFEIREDILVPESQLLQDTFGLLEWSKISFEALMFNREDEEDE